MKFIKFNRRDIENMSYMFNECISLEELIFSKINTNNVKNRLVCSVDVYY